MLFSSKNTVSTIDKDAVVQLHKQVKSAFSTVKEEMEEHLQAINENTSEVQQQSDHLAELDNRMSKLEERMDEIHLMFKQIMNSAKVDIRLNPEEQKVFLILYTHDSFLSAEQLADRFAIPMQTVHDCLLSMSDKGIAVEKELLNEETFYKLEEEFRALQAKQQLVKIDEAITQQYQNKLLKKFFSS